MPLRVDGRVVRGTWVRHVPHGADLLGRAQTPADGRWQRGEVVPGLYLADTVETATAEWYRSLAEWGLSPQDHVPYDHHQWRLDLQLADLTEPAGLRALGLSALQPDRRTWPVFQRVGERLWREGWAGLIAQSAARPSSQVVCVFSVTWPPAGCEPLTANAVTVIPPPPQGMRT